MRENSFDPMEMIKEVLLFLGVSVLAFGWMLLMLLIVSFVALSYITLKLKLMLIIAGAFMVLADILFVRSRVLKKREDRRIKRMLES